jgi:hypothetical protein
LTCVIRSADQFSVCASFEPSDSSSTTVTQTSPNMNSLPSATAAPNGAWPAGGSPSELFAAGCGPYSVAGGWRRTSARINGCVKSASASQSASGTVAAADTKQSVQAASSSKPPPLNSMRDSKGSNRGRRKKTTAVVPADVHRPASSPTAWPTRQIALRAKKT